jgi:hypothetical protein
MFNKLLEWIAVVMLISALLFPRLLHRADYMTIDENAWLLRSANYYYAVSNKEFSNTFQRTHPGVLTMWAGTIGFMLTFPEYKDLNPGYLATYDGLENFLQPTQVTPLEILAAGQLAATVIIALALLLSYILLRKLIGVIPALVGFLLIALNPFFISHRTILHVDGLMTAMTFLSILLLMTYLWEGRKKGYLLLSGLVAALSWLAKTPAMVLIPLTTLMLWSETSRQEDNNPFKALWAALPTILLWLGTAAICYALFWPSMWVLPLATLSNIFGVSLHYAISDHEFPLFFNGTISKSSEFGTHFYPFVYLWRSTPVEIIGLILTILALIFRFEPFNQKKIRSFSRGWFNFIILYLIMMTLASRKFDRYLIPICPPLNVLAGLGWVSLGKYLVKGIQQKSTQTWVRGVNPALLIGVVFIQFFQMIGSAPYYGMYYNPLLGGLQKAQDVMTVGWGEGLEQAASYLNEKPQAEEDLTMSWYGYGPFSFYYSGNAVDTHLLMKDTPELFNELDYIVTYVNQWQRRFPEPLFELLEDVPPEKVISFHGLEIVRIYNAADVFIGD